MSPRASVRERGFALLGALLVLCVLALGAAALAASAAGSARISAAGLATHQARLAAFSGAHAALQAWPREAIAGLAAGVELPVAEGRLPGGGAYRGSVERLNERTVLVRGRGVVERGGAPVAEWSVGRIVALACGCDLAAAVVAALDVAGDVAVPAGGAVRGEGVAGVRAESAILAGGFAGEVSGDPPLDSTGFSGPEVWTSLAGAAERSGAGTSTPGPVVDANGACDRTAPSNWGSPSGGPCGDFAPVIEAASDVRIDGGVGQGILIGDGDVELAGGAEFRGVVVAAGDVVIGPGALLRGAIVASGPTSRVEVAGEVRLDPADLAQALEAAFAGRPFDPAGRRWVPLF